MGLFDLPSFALGWIDSAILGFLPDAVRLALWGVAAGVASMQLYKLASPQGAIQASKRKAAGLRAELDCYDGDVAGAWPLIGQLMRVSLRRVRLAAVPAVLASVPLLFVLVWVEAEYGYRFPRPDEPVAVSTASAAHHAAWVERGTPGNGAVPRVQVSDGDGRPVVSLPVIEPVPLIHKWRWWNLLIGNPVGYLPDNATVDRIEIALPRREVVPSGPAWLRGWEALFFASLLLGSVTLKIAGRID